MSIGNTALHLAMESGHGEAAVTLIEAGADRERVSGMSDFRILVVLTTRAEDQFGRTDAGRD